jgi:hypothetical protein
MFSPSGSGGPRRKSGIKDDDVVADDHRLLTSPTHRSDAPDTINTLDTLDVVSPPSGSNDSIASPSGLRHELESLVAAHHALGAQASDLGAELQQARMEAEALRAHLGSVGSESSMGSSASKGSATKSRSVITISPRPSGIEDTSSPTSVHNYTAPNASPTQPGPLKEPEHEKTSEPQVTDLNSTVKELENKLKSAQEELVAVESRRCAEALTAYAEHQHLQSVINELQQQIEKQTAEISMHRAAAAKAIITTENARAAQESQARAEKARADELQTLVLSLRDQVVRLQLGQQQVSDSSSDDDRETSEEIISGLQQALQKAEQRIAQLHKEKEDQSILAVRRQAHGGMFLNVPRSRQLFEPSAWTVLPPLTPDTQRKEATASLPDYYAVPCDKKKNRSYVGRFTRTSIAHAAIAALGVVVAVGVAHHSRRRPRKVNSKPQAFEESFSVHVSE